MAGNGPDAGMAYDAEMKRHFGAVMKHALAKRHYMTTRWEQRDFEALCRESWIAYKGYKKRIVRHENQGEELHA
jgi:hypothetical protein